ncbi:hypothetical protein BGX26_007331 [Mortierella sp. AD094]|nr:hypothetical protein BGX26_007331 [Mortierella sp. AD094]
MDYSNYSFAESLALVEEMLSQVLSQHSFLPQRVQGSQDCNHALPSEVESSPSAVNCTSTVTAQHLEEESIFIQANESSDLSVSDSNSIDGILGPPRVFRPRPRCTRHCTRRYTRRCTRRCTRHRPQINHIPQRRPFCSICNMTFTNWRYLRRHLSNHFSQDANRVLEILDVMPTAETDFLRSPEFSRVICVGCSTMYAHRGTFNNHLESERQKWIKAQNWLHQLPMEAIVSIAECHRGDFTRKTWDSFFKDIESKWGDCGDSHSRIVRSSVERLENPMKWPDCSELSFMLEQTPGMILVWLMSIAPPCVAIGRVQLKNPFTMEAEEIDV